MDIAICAGLAAIVIVIIVVTVGMFLVKKIKAYRELGKHGLMRD